MQLLDDSDGLFPALDSEVVKRRGARKLYFVHDGRNAWHSTWVQRYRDGCMHSTLQSAKEHAEGERVQGSVFYIQELPAVLLAGESLVLAVTEVATDDVLVGYSPNTPFPLHTTWNPTGNAIVVGRPLWEA